MGWQNQPSKPIQQNDVLNRQNFCFFEQKNIFILVRTKPAFYINNTIKTKYGLSTKVIKKYEHYFKFLRLIFVFLRNYKLT